MAVDTDEIRDTGHLLMRTFRPGDEEAFRVLNERWISTIFTLEAADREVLNDPHGQILNDGGEICVAEIDGAVVGCCALIAIGTAEYELAKMTVSEAARGRGIGRKLLQFVIDQARSMGAHRLYLESNTKVADAIHLYEELGFRHLPAPEHVSKYARADTFMEMFL
jgi:putative acetyltransferase